MCGNCEVIISPANDLTHTGKVNDNYFKSNKDVKLKNINYEN